MSVADELTPWFRHSVSIERLIGTGPFGDSYAAVTSELAMVDDKRRLVRAADGSQVVSSTTIYLAAGTAYVSTGSRVTLPATFGVPQRRSIVLASSVHDGGGQPTPDHLELALQ